MSRPILAAAFGTALTCLPALAQAQTSVLYGLMDASGSNVKPVGSSNDRWQLDNGNMSRSFLGVRGSEDLGGGLRAVWRLESYLRVDNGTSGRFDGDGYWAREASVGLSGAFGTTVIGRSASPLWSAVVNFNPFGESIGFSPSARQTFGGLLGDTRWNNSVSYVNNASDPLRVNIAYNADETNARSGGHNVGASLSYITGPFAATVVAERVRNSAQALPAGFDQQVIFYGGATYDFKFLRVYGQAGRIKTEAATEARTTLYQLGAAVPIGTSLILAAYGHSRTKTPGLTSTDKQGSVGYDYFLSKNTDIYVAALYEKLSKVSSGRSFAGGVRLRF